MEPPKGGFQTVVFLVLVGGFLVSMVTGFGYGLAVGLPVTAVLLALAFLADHQEGVEARRPWQADEKKR
jgi:ABC-type transport system involved in cytochrome c biogenesis permease component